MLHDREEFDVGEPHLVHIVCQPRCNLAITERTVVFVAHPRAEVHFINRHRSVQRVGGRALLKKFRIIPCVVEVPNHRSRPRRPFAEKADRIGLFNLVTQLGRVNVKFVQSALVNARNETFPNSRSPTRLELMRLRVPSIETADHRHLASIRSPDAKDGPLGSLRFRRVRPHLVVNAIVAAFIE
jgi:hypothetical protein